MAAVACQDRQQGVNGAGGAGFAQGLDQLHAVFRCRRAVGGRGDRTVGRSGNVQPQRQFHEGGLGGRDRQRPLEGGCKRPGHLGKRAARQGLQHSRHDLVDVSPVEGKLHELAAGRERAIGPLGQESPRQALGDELRG
jgi:hypothetical protein